MEYIITQEHSGKTVRDFLRRDCAVSATLLRQLKALPNGITLNGEHVTVRAVLHTGQVLRLNDWDTMSSQNIVPTPGNPDIVYEDEYLTVVNKPFGMPVHPSPGHASDTLANIMMWHYRAHPFVFRAVNRLDSGTGGLLCIAKNAHCAAQMSLQMSAFKIKRIYEAVLCGELEQDSGTIDAPIGLSGEGGIKRCVMQNGERAVTHFKVLERKNGLSRVEISLETGRTHQIRVHFSHLGYPVWGDFLYGTERDFCGFALFSKSLSFTHPMTKEAINITVSPPPLFDRLMNGSK